MPIDTFKNEMGRTGIASQKEQCDALLALISKVETLDAEHMKLEEEKDQEVAGLSAKIDDLEKDHNETKRIVADLSEYVSHIPAEGE